MLQLEKQREFMQKRRQAQMMMRAPRNRQEAQKQELERLMKVNGCQHKYLAKHWIIQIWPRVKICCCDAI